MGAAYNASLAVVIKTRGDILQKRRNQFERILINSEKNIKELRRTQEVTVAKIKDLQATSKKLSEEGNETEVDIHTKKNRELANKEEVCCLESTILELKKKISVETDCQQHLLVKKSEAETEKEKAQKELLKRHETLLKAMAYYKRKLRIRLRFDENGLILVHFLNISTPGCEMCCLKVSHDGSKWKLLEMEPVLPFEKTLANKLETTQDIQGFISRVRKLFIQMSGSRKQHATGKKVSKVP